MKVPLPSPLLTTHAESVTTPLDGLEIEQLVSFVGTFSELMVTLTSVPTGPEVGLRESDKPLTWNEVCAESPFGFPVTVMM
jgi:hypothetical protein